ncbi:MAG: VOC family protein [Hyphomicrobiaceae bacterium]
MTGTELSYIALASRDVPAVCEFLGDDLALPRHDITSPTGAQQAAFAVGRTALVVFEAGDPFLSSPQTGIDHIALVGDFAGQASAPEDTPGLNQTRQQTIANAETCGVNVRLTQSIGLAAEPGDHIERVDHIGIASSDNIEAERIFLGSYGCIYESRQTDMEVSQAIESFTSDKYGVIYHTRRPQPIGGLRVSFLTVGDCELEFLQNFDPAQGFAVEHGAPGNTKQDQGAIGRYIEKRGAGLHHIALKCHDIDPLLERLGNLGRRMIDRTGRPGSRRGRIGFVHPASLGGVLLHFVERQDL